MIDKTTDDSIIELGLSAFLAESRNGETDIKNNNYKMNSFKIVGGAIVSAVIVAVLGYLVSIGDVWKIDFHRIVNIAVLTGAASILKYLGTSRSNKFAGVLPMPE